MSASWRVIAERLWPKDSPWWVFAEKWDAAQRRVEDEKAAA